jgi:hypothetical protein
MFDESCLISYLQRVKQLGLVVVGNIVHDDNIHEVEFFVSAFGKHIVVILAPFLQEL